MRSVCILYLICVSFSSLNVFVCSFCLTFHILNNGPDYRVGQKSNPNTLHNDYTVEVIIGKIYWPTVVELMSRYAVCRLSVVVCDVLYCGKTVHLS